MTDNLVPKNVKTIRIKFYASPTVVGKGNSLRFWESSSPAMTKKIWIDVDQSVIFARYWRDLLYHNVGVTVSFLMVDPTAKKIFHCHVQVNGFGELVNLTLDEVRCQLESMKGIICVDHNHLCTSYHSPIWKTRGPLTSITWECFRWQYVH